MSSVTTHVLDAAVGRPAAGMRVRLERADGSLVAEARTDDDGRVRGLGEPQPGEHRIVFATGEWFAAQSRETFYPEVVVTFRLGDGHHHVPLLLSPFAYSTYRGS
jgi:5-hydroxyisourate hydrolase